MRVALGRVGAREDEGEVIDTSGLERRSAGQKSRCRLCEGALRRVAVQRLQQQHGAELVGGTGPRSASAEITEGKS